MSGLRNAMLVALMATAIAPVARAEDAYVKLGVSLTTLADQGKTYSDGVLVPGSDYQTNSVALASVTGGYFFSDHFAVEASVNLPATTQNVPSGTLAGLPNFGDDTFMTTDLMVNYHPERGQALSPYFGVGVRHHFTIKGTDGPIVNNVHVGPGTGMVLQGGLDYNISDAFAAFIDLKKAFYSTVGTGDMGPAHIATHAQRDPVTAEFGVAYRFGGGDSVTADDNDPPTGNWFLRAGATMLHLQDTLHLSVGGAPFPGARLNTDDQFTPTFQIGYTFYDHLSAVLTAGLPPEIDASGGGTAAPLGKLSHVTYGPSALTVQYHPFDDGFFRPYIGFGGSYMIIFKSTDAGVMSNMRMTDDLAPVVEAGADFMVTDRYGFYAEVKKAWLETRATAALSGVPVVGYAPIHPLGASVGAVFKF